MSDAITIRKAKAGDVPELVRFLIRLDAHVAGVPPEELGLTETGQRQLRQRLESFIDADGRLVLVAAVAGGTLIGMGHIHIWHHSDIWTNPERQGLKSGYIDDFWVEPDWRGKGVATRLVQRLLDFAREQGINELVLEYALHNPEADIFWKRLGFRPTGVRASAWLSDVMETLPAPERTVGTKRH